jgi:hypothetical protein
MSVSSDRVCADFSAQLPVSQRPMDGSTQNNLNHTLNLAPPALEELPPVASLFGVDKQTNRPLHNQLVSPAGNFFEPRRPMGYM